MANSSSQDVVSGTAFIIKELTGEQREIQLSGRALPYRPIKFVGNMEGDKTWYAGNPIATAQMQGPTEDPSDFNGFWKDKYVQSVTAAGGGVEREATILLNGVAQESVADAIELMDDVRRKGQQLEVSWAHLKRQGWLRTFSQTWHRIQDCEWDMHFEWISQGDVEVPSVMSSRTSITDTTSKFANHVSTLQKLANALNGVVQFISGTVNTINQTINDLQDSVDDLTSAIASNVDAVLSPLDVARRMSAALEGIKDDAQALADHMRSTPVYQWIAPSASPSSSTTSTTTGGIVSGGGGGAGGSTGAGGATTSSQSASSIASSSKPGTFSTLTTGQALAVDLWISDLITEAQHTAWDAADAQSQLQTDLNPDLMGTFIAPQNTDLRIVATLYYGVPDDWKRIAVFNEFNSSAVPLGAVVFVPKIIAGDQQQVGTE